MRSLYGTKAAAIAAEAVRLRTDSVPSIGVILGSGLGGVASAIEAPVRIPYREMPGFPQATVAGHAGELILGTLEGRSVAAFSGRFHIYEGHSAALAGFPVRVLDALGARTLIVSNAAGSARRELQPGTLVLLKDHINLMFANPIVGPVEQGDERFPDMAEPYDPELRELARTVARDRGIALGEGVYAALPGPNYETKAEVRMLQTLGADVIGMSTVPEVIVARARGMRVVGFSCVTNLACGLAAAPITHDEVLATTARVAAQLQLLVRGVVAAI